jgi:hypothetical protein
MRCVSNLSTTHRPIDNNAFQIATPESTTPTSKSRPPRTTPARARLAEVIKGGGFSDVHRATETPFNLILEARP